MVQMSEHLDYLIDVADSTRAPGNEYQRQVIRQLKCDFGTIGGPLVEPPQHWERDRWFLPTARTQGEHLKELADNGGRACEYFFHIRANPGDEVSFWVAGKLLSDIAHSLAKAPARDARTALRCLEARQPWTGSPRCSSKPRMPT